jgi:hypothetical protein
MLLQLVARFDGGIG